MMMMRRRRRGGTRDEDSGKERWAAERILRTGQRDISILEWRS
jgi:hypothetical protein